MAMGAARRYSFHKSAYRSVIGFLIFLCIVVFLRQFLSNRRDPANRFDHRSLEQVPRTITVAKNDATQTSVSTNVRLDNEHAEVVISKSSGGIFANDGKIRNCVTGSVIGKIPVGVTSTKPLLDLSASPDNSTPVASNVDMERAAKRLKHFETIFVNKTWETWDSSYLGLSASGHGSTIRYAQETIAVLHSVISAAKLQLQVDRVSLLDLSCGDMQWMGRFLETHEDVDYTGFDIVPQLIAHHRKTFADRPWKFEQRDMVSDDVSLDKYDIILARHTSQHLTTPDFLKVLKRLSKRYASGQRPRFLLATSYSSTGVWTQENDIDPKKAAGDRPLNLEVPPISLMPPMCIMNDGPRGTPQYLGLWQLPLQQVEKCTVSVVHTTIGQLKSCVNWSLTT